MVTFTSAFKASTVLVSLSSLTKRSVQLNSFRTVNCPSKSGRSLPLDSGRTWRRIFFCEAVGVSVDAESSASDDGGGGRRRDGGKNWVPAVPLAALPRGERRVIIQEGETILLLWYKDQVFAIENRSPAEGAYSEGLINAKLTKDGCIACPTTDSTFDLKTGEIIDWYPNNPVLRVLTPALKSLYVYPVKVDGENIYISMSGTATTSDASAEIVFSGRAQPGVTAADVNVDEVQCFVGLLYSLLDSI